MAKHTLPQPLGQVDYKILECLERVDGALPIAADTLWWQLLQAELVDAPITYAELHDRLYALQRAGLITTPDNGVKIAPAARDFLPAPKPREVPDVLSGLQADEIRQSPARAATGTDSGHAA